MEIFLAVAFVALIAALWAAAMYRFQLRWWTIIVTILLLAVLFAAFFRAEDEDPEGDLPTTSVANASA